MEFVGSICLASKFVLVPLELALTFVSEVFTEFLGCFFFFWTELRKLEFWLVTGGGAYPVIVALRPLLNRPCDGL